MITTYTTDKINGKHYRIPSGLPLKIQKRPVGSFQDSFAKRDFDVIFHELYLVNGKPGWLRFYYTKGLKRILVSAHIKYDNVIKLR